MVSQFLETITVIRVIKLEKILWNYLKKYQSNLDINCNLKIVDYLAITLNSDTGI